jgi:hypothetical protein
MVRYRKLTPPRQNRSGKVRPSLWDKTVVIATVAVHDHAPRPEVS